MVVFLPQIRGPCTKLRISKGAIPKIQKGPVGMERGQYPRRSTDRRANRSENRLPAHTAKARAQHVRMFPIGSRRCPECSWQRRERHEFSSAGIYLHTKKKPRRNNSRGSSRETMVGRPPDHKLEAYSRNVSEQCHAHSKPLQIPLSLITWGCTPISGDTA